MKTKATLKKLFPKTPLGVTRAVVLLILAAVLIFVRVFWTADELFFVCLIIFMLFGQGKEYLRRFLPFVVLILSYDSLRSFIPFIDKHVHYTEMINFDHWLGNGTVPTVTLQHWLYHGHLQWYDFYFYLLYMMHFLAPFAIALLIWKLRPAYYWRYISALLVLSYAGFLTYLLFPAAPPWLASQMGLIPHIEKLSTDIWWSLGIHDFPTIYNKLSPNEVAAVPSLHAAYPMLEFLFLNRIFGRKVSLPFLIYPVSLWFGVVYMGEHYAFDVLLGIAYALVAYFATNYAISVWSKHRAQPKATPAAISPTPAH